MLTFNKYWRTVRNCTSCTVKRYVIKRVQRNNADVAVAVKRYVIIRVQRNMQMLKEYNETITIRVRGNHNFITYELFALKDTEL